MTQRITFAVARSTAQRTNEYAKNIETPHNMFGSVNYLQR